MELPLTNQYQCSQHVRLQHPSSIRQCQHLKQRLEVNQQLKEHCNDHQHHQELQILRNLLHQLQSLKHPFDGQ